jgi:glyoxylase-like metal-dependent hydrolase (beta-lactamase superfamily II)
MTEIVRGVHIIEGLGMGRAYLYEESDRLTLIDTSLPGNAGRIFAAIERLGRTPQDLRQVVATHWHVDHVGSLAEIVERSGAQVLVHALDAPIVRGDKQGGGPTGVWRPLGPLLERVSPAQKSVHVDRELQDGDEIDVGGAARIVHVPGHTAGSIALYLPSRRVLFTGDTISNTLGLRVPIGMFTEDHAEVRRSIAKLAALDFDAAFFGHGAPMDKDASNAFRRFANRLAQ